MSKSLDLIWGVPAGISQWNAPTLQEILTPDWLYS